LRDRSGRDAGFVEEEVGSGRAGQDRVRGGCGHEHDCGWLREGRQATSERQSFAPPRRDVDQHDVGTKRGRYVLCVCASFEVRDNRESFGLEERYACRPEGRVRIDDQHANLLSRWLPPVPFVLHAATMPLPAPGRIGAVACQIAG
jgi:hypothetical protein